MADTREPQPQVVMTGEQYDRQQLAAEMKELSKAPLDKTVPGGRYQGSDGQLHDAEGKIVEGDRAGTDVSDYDSMPKEDLQAEADRRHLEVKGTGSNDSVLKKDLVDALRLADGNG